MRSVSGKELEFKLEFTPQELRRIGANPALEGLIPHTAILVRLDEGILLTSNLVEGDDRVKIGAPVEVVFEPASDDISLPKFRLV